VAAAPPPDEADEGTRARYVAIITDGNGRWAEQRGLPVTEGHRAGAENVKARLRDAVDLGVEELTIYAFSTENWARSYEEVRALVQMFSEYIERETPELHGEGVRLRFVGRRDPPVPERIVAQMEWAEQLTAANERITFFIPFNYGGRAEIVDAARRFTGTTEEEFRAHLYAPDMHDPDLVIRTSGEQRLSGFLLWQSANSEFYFCDVYWPEFRRTDFLRALRSYANRQRRFGT